MIPIHQRSVHEQEIIPIDMIVFFLSFFGPWSAAEPCRSPSKPLAAGTPSLDTPTATTAAATTATEDGKEHGRANGRCRPVALVPPARLNPKA